MFKIAVSRIIEENDVYAVTNSMRSDQNTERFAQLWKLEMRKEKPSIFRVITKVFGLEFFCLMMLNLLSGWIGR